MSASVILGVDIGTTSVKVCLIDEDTREELSSESKDTQSNIPPAQNSHPGAHEQNVRKIVSTLHNCLLRLPKEYLRQVKHIGICGQMHGIVLWRSPAWTDKFELINENISNLVTWQDTRCDHAYLARLPRPDSHLRAYTGYGINTLLWLRDNEPDAVSQYTHAATIQDFIVAMLCDLQEPIMSNQNAASWGYFNCKLNAWNESILRSHQPDFPLHLLPKIQPSGTIVGKLTRDWLGINKDTPINVALGDLQCSVLATLQFHTDAIINISTSAQIAFIDESFTPLEHYVEADEKAKANDPHDNSKATLNSTANEFHNFAESAIGAETNYAREESVARPHKDDSRLTQTSGVRNVPKSEEPITTNVAKSDTSESIRNSSADTPNVGNAKGSDEIKRVRFQLTGQPDIDVKQENEEIQKANINDKVGDRRNEQFQDIYTDLEEINLDMEANVGVLETGGEDETGEGVDETGEGVDEEPVGYDEVDPIQINDQKVDGASSARHTRDQNDRNQNDRDQTNQNHSDRDQSNQNQSDRVPKTDRSSNHIEHFPYFHGKYIAVGASMNGGNCLATFVCTLQAWFKEFGFNVPQNQIWSKLINATDAQGHIERNASDLEILPTLLGDRHVTRESASILNVTPGNLGVNKMFLALCKGIIGNLHTIMDSSVLHSSKIDRIIGIGSCLTRNHILQHYIEQVYGLALKIDERASRDASYGAAISTICDGSERVN